MSIGKLFCNLLIGIIVYGVGFFSGAATMEKINDECVKRVTQNAEQLRARRRARYEKERLKAEA